MTADQITAAAVALGCPTNSIRIYKDEYRCAEPDWITGAFASNMVQFWCGNAIPGSEAFSCLEYSGVTVGLSRVAWAKSANPDAQLYALATGSAHFLSLDHALFVAAHYDDAGEPYLCAYETIPTQENATSPVRILFPTPLSNLDWKSCERLDFP